MEAGEFATVRDLALSVNMADRHVSRQLRLAYLASEALKRLIFGRDTMPVRACASLRPNAGPGAPPPANSLSRGLEIVNFLSRNFPHLTVLRPPHEFAMNCAIGRSFEKDGQLKTPSY